MSASARCWRATSTIASADGRLPISLNGAAEDAGDRLQVLHVDSRRDPNGEVRERYRLRRPDWMLVRPDQIVAAFGVPRSPTRVAGRMI